MNSPAGAKLASVHGNLRGDLLRLRYSMKRQFPGNVRRSKALRRLSTCDGLDASKTISGNLRRLQNFVAHGAFDFAAILVAHLVRQFERSRLHDDAHRRLFGRVWRELRLARELPDRERRIVAQRSEQTGSERPGSESAQAGIEYVDRRGGGGVAVGFGVVTSPSVSSSAGNRAPRPAEGFRFRRRPIVCGQPGLLISIPRRR